MKRTRSAQSCGVGIGMAQASKLRFFNSRGKIMSVLLGKEGEKN